MEIDEKTKNEIMKAVEMDLPDLSQKIDKIHDLLAGTKEMPEFGLIPRVKVIEETLKDIGMLTHHLSGIPDMAQRLLKLEIIVLGVELDGKAGLLNDIYVLQSRPEKQMSKWTRIVAIIGGSLGILSTMITAIMFLAQVI